MSSSYFAADGLWQDFPENWYRFSWTSNIGPGIWSYFKQTGAKTSLLYWKMTVGFVCLLYISYTEIELYLNHSQIDRLVFIMQSCFCHTFLFDFSYSQRRHWIVTLNMERKAFHSNFIFHQAEKSVSSMLTSLFYWNLIIWMLHILLKGRKETLRLLQVSVSDCYFCQKLFSYVWMVHAEKNILCRRKYFLNKIYLWFIDEDSFIYDLQW